MINRLTRIGLLVLTIALQTQAAEIGQQDFASLQRQGTGDFVSGGLFATLPPAVDLATEFPRLRAEDISASIVGEHAQLRAPAPLAVPLVPNSRISLVNRRFSGFDALNHADQRNAGTGAFVNTQFSLEPPDQALCVGNGFVLESVNLALAVFRADGTRLAGPTALNQFFNLKPSVKRTAPVRFGEFTSDPRCIFDQATGRFFLVLLELDTNPLTGNFTGPTSLLIAVSKTSNPTQGFNLFRLSTTGDGANCPCFGDQPLMGSDANGFFLSTNAFSLVTGRFVGVQIYAMSKRALAAGDLPPFVLHVRLPSATQADGSRDFSVQPAFVPSGRLEGSRDTAWFAGIFSISRDLQNALSVYSLRPTSALLSPPTAGLTFSFAKQFVNTETFGVPPDAEQKRGTLPLGSVVNPKVFEILATNEHRLQQVTADDNGTLWTSLTTVLASPGEDDVKAGVAWFAIRVEANGDRARARLRHQGYVAVPNAAAFFPAIGVGRESVAIGFAISGPGFFPSTGFARVEDGDLGAVHFAGVGTNSEDGFTGYPAFGAPCFPPGADGSQICEARWGDYGAAAADERGNLFMASEYISPRPRTVNANWGTFVTRLANEDEDDRD